MKIRVVDALKKCKEEGYQITRAGLYHAGKNHGFLIKHGGLRELEFDKVKFMAWLRKAKEEIPENYITVKQLSDEFGINIVYAYKMAKILIGEGKGKRIGSGSGVMYVDRNAVEDYIKTSEEESVINWED